MRSAPACRAGGCGFKPRRPRQYSKPGTVLPGTILSWRTKERSRCTTRLMPRTNPVSLSRRALFGRGLLALLSLPLIGKLGKGEASEAPAVASTLPETGPEFDPFEPVPEDFLVFNETHCELDTPEIVDRIRDHVGGFKGELIYLDKITVQYASTERASVFYTWHLADGSAQGSDVLIVNLENICKTR